MRLKPFVSDSIASAFALVRDELGADAVILNTENLPDGRVRVMVGVEENDFSFTAEEKIVDEPRRRDFDDSLLREKLDYHGVLPVVSERILALVRRLWTETGNSDIQVLVENCFRQMFAYYDILEPHKPLKLFMGIPGSGKSTAIAKTATQARFQKLQSAIISTDNIRAGANEQLRSFADILQIPFYFCDTAKKLYQKTSELRGQFDLILIDTPGVNPFSAAEIDRLRPYVEAVKAEMIMTLDGGRNVSDSVEIADIFSSLGTDCLLPSRLDLTRRAGAVLSVPGCTGFRLGAAGVGASIVQGLSKVDSRSLTKLILA